jgi:hypothetical protein
VPLDVVFRHAEGTRQPGGVDLHAPDVALRRLILRVEGERQRFERRQIQRRNTKGLSISFIGIRSDK